MKVMGILLAVLMTALSVQAWRLHKDPDVSFNLLDLLMENGRVSRLSVMLMGGFTIVSWVMVGLQLTGKMTEGYMSVYGGMCIIPILTRMVAGQPNLPSGKLPGPGRMKS